MRVLHIGKFFPPFAGGMENYLYDLMLALGARGVEQAALVHHHERGRPTDVETIEFSSGGGADVWRVRTFGSVLYAPVAPSFGTALERLAGSFRPDIVHAQIPNTSAFWLLRSRELRDVPVVVQWQSDVMSEEAERLLNIAYRAYRPFEQALLRRASAVAVATEPYLVSSPMLTPWTGKCVVNPLGLDPHRLEDVAAEPAGCEFTDDASLKVLFVGRLSYYKGVSYLIEAARRTYGVELVVVGAGDEGEKLASLTACPELASRVHFAGHVSDSEKNRLMSKADVLCLPSISRHEAYGLVLAEAMGMGTPVIATSVEGSGMSWVVGNDGAGWLVPPRDPRALGDLLARLRDQRDLLAAAAAIARRRFRSVFDIHAVASSMEAVYERVLASDGHAGSAAA